MTDSSGPWNDVTVHRLMALRDRGLSAARIGRELGVSRNAVIGKLARMGFALKGRQSVKARVRKRKYTPRRPEPSMPEVQTGKPEPDIEPDIGSDIEPERMPETTPDPAAAPGPDPEPNAARGAVAAVMALRPRSCRWPIGNPKDADFRFCGKRRVRGAWCGEHADIVRTSAQEAS